MKKNKILLVEDETLVAVDGSAALKKFGFDVITVSNGEEAVVKAAEKEFDLILMDIDLGEGIDGTETARLILEIQEIPIVFLTSHSEREMVERVRGITRYGYVIKNSGNFVLQSSIEMAFELYEAHKKKKESEIFRRTIVQTIPDMVWLKNPFGVYLACNYKFEQFLGKRENEIIGKTDYDLVEKEIADSFIKNDRTVMATGKQIKYEEWLTHSKDGRKTLMETIKTPLIGADGLAGVLGISRDITDRKRNEEALQKRIIALSRPLDDPSGIKFSDLFDIDEIQRIQDEFSDAARVASIITNPDGTPITRQSNFCRLCNDIIRNTDIGLSNCFKSDSILGRHDPEGPIVQPCLSGGLWDAGASITVGGKHIANWMIGQIKNEELDEEKMLEYAEKIGADKEVFRQALSEVPVMSSDQFNKIARVLHSLANELSMKAYQNVQQARFITEKEKAEKEMFKREQELIALIQYIPDFICRRDLDARIVFCNNAVQKLHDLPLSEIIGKKTSEISKDNSVGILFDETTLEVARTGDIKEIEIKIKNKKNDGFVKHHIRFIPERNKHGTVSGVISIGRIVK